MNTRDIYMLQELLWNYYAEFPHTQKQLEAIKTVYADIAQVAVLDDAELSLVRIDRAVRRHL